MSKQYDTYHESGGGGHQHPEHHHESIHCPETGNHCYDPLCGKGHCLIKSHREKREEPKCLSEKQWDELMRRLSANPFNYHSDPKEVFLNIVAEQVRIIDRLTKHDPEEHHHRKHHEPARFFSAALSGGNLINSVQFFNVKSNKHMSVSFKQAGGATATLTPLAADGVTPAPNGVDLTKPVTAVSSHPEFFTATVVVDSNNVPTLPLQVTLKGVADGAGTITYGATSIDGSAITLVDNVTVADAPPITPAASFTVEYTVF